MSEPLKVQAVEGRLFPHQPPRAGHVGYRVCQPGETPDHVIPRRDAQGKRADVELVRCGVVEVPNTAHYRRALDDCDITRAESAPVAKPVARTIKSED
jgi:hypothetical protein